MEDHGAKPAELPRPSRRLLYLGLVAALVSLGLDQASKLAILSLFDGQQGRFMSVLPVFNLYLTYNHGITFGLFNNSAAANALIFSGLALAIVVVLVVALTRVTAWHNAVALGMIIGGALGNLIGSPANSMLPSSTSSTSHLGDAHFYVFNIGDLRRSAHQCRRAAPGQLADSAGIA